MTDCNNQLVVKVQVEPSPTEPVTSSQPSVTNQPPSTQPAPNSQPPTIVLPTPATTATCASRGSKPAASAEASASPLDAVERPAPLEENLRWLVAQNPDVQLEEAPHSHVGAAVRLPVAEPSGIDASLSDLDRIGMGVRITRTMRATSVPVEGEQPSTSGALATQTVSTHQGIQGLLTYKDVEDLDILDLRVDASEDFSDIDPDLADELFGEDPKKKIGNWVTKGNQEVTDSLGDETQPDLESGLSSLNLNDDEIEREASGVAPSAASAPAATVTTTKPGPQPCEKMDVTEECSETIPA